MNLCIYGLAKTLALSTTAFSLSWTHSVEGTRWEESWRVSELGLQIIEARIKGSGAGMEPPSTAVLRDGWLVYSVKIPRQKELVLANAGARGDDWLLCSEETACLALSSRPGEVITLRPCQAANGLR